MVQRLIMFSVIDWNPILIAFIAFLTTTVSAAFGYLAMKLAKMGKVVDAVHTLTNGGMGTQKRMLAEVTAAKFAITKDPVDGQAAELAMKDWFLHVGQEAKVDAKP